MPTGRPGNRDTRRGRGEREGGGGGPVKKELELVERPGLRFGGEERVVEVALDHDQGHQPAEGVDAKLTARAGARAPLRPGPLPQTIRLYRCGLFPSGAPDLLDLVVPNLRADLHVYLTARFDLELALQRGYCREG